MLGSEYRPLGLDPEWFDIKGILYLNYSAEPNNSQY